MSLETLCRIGMEARDLAMKDRISLQARVNVKIINGESEERIMAYAQSYKREFSLDLSSTEGIGSKLVRNLARMGWIFPLLAMAVHYATR
jgi:hypothetical protein